MSKEFEVILRAFNNSNQKFDLNIIDDIALKLDISAIESQEIGELFGISSQTFTVPGTDVSNQFFNNLFDLGTTPAVAFGKTVPCQVLADGQAIFTGKLYISDIISDDTNNVIYNCVVTNETIDFKTQIDTKTLASLSGSFSKYNHTYNWSNISSSWDNNLFSGSVFYPLVNYGSQVNDPTIPTIGFSPNGGTFISTGSMDNIATPLKVSQFKPAIQVKTILDEIFASINYKYTSSFVNSDYFKSIYYLDTSNEKFGASFTDQTLQLVTATPTVSQSIVYNNPPLFVAINYGTELVDAGNNYQPVSSTYTAVASGSYAFSSNLTFTVTTGSAPFINAKRKFEFQIQVNSLITNTIVVDIGTSTSGIVPMPQTIINLNPGDFVQIYGRFVGRKFGESFITTPGVNSSWLKVNGVLNGIGGTINIGSIFSPDLMIKDFLKGLSEKFNLVIEPVRNEKNILRIEPFNDWIDQGTVVDWTDIVDRSVKYKVTSPLINQARNLYFSDAIDEDVLNKNYYTAFNKIYGEYKFTTALDLASGNKRIGEKFAATPTRYINNSATVEIPWLCKEETTKALTSFDFKGRLLHKTPTVRVPANEAKGNNGSTTGFYYVLDGAVKRAINFYSTALPTYHTAVTIIPGNYKVLSAPSSSLHFDSATYRQYKNSPWTAWIPGAYDNYWSFYVNEIYDIDARLLTCNIVLKPTEIPNIQLNDKIFIDGHYYRINKINGANLVSTDSVQVELLKTAPRKIPYNGRRRILTPRANEPNAYIDAIIDTYNDDGSTTYADFETGEVINDQDIITQVVGIDGYDYYTGTTWDNESYQIYNPNIISLGPNKYNETMTNVINVGSGNTIPDFTANSVVIANDFALPDESSNLAVFQPIRQVTASYSPANGQVLVGSVKTQGTKAVEYLQGTYSASQAIELTGSDGQYSYYNLTYTGSNGYTSLNLPDVTLIDGLRYQFQVNDTNASKYFNLIPSSSQTIDGNPEKPLFITGSMYEIQVVSGSWKTITQPALGAGNTNATTASFISVYDTTDQTLDGALTASVMTFNNTDFNRGITLVSSSRFTLSQGGAYNLAFSAQLDKTTGTKHDCWIWLRKNGSDVANTNTQVTMGGGSSDKAVAAWNFFLSGSAGDYYELAWTADNTSVYLNAANAVPGVYPAVPSVIATVNSMY
jgi:hypothetical protein